MYPFCGIGKLRVFFKDIYSGVETPNLGTAFLISK
jgi:hypothetical protein